MVAYAKTQSVTPQDYLERERAAQTKSEYYDGVIIAMAGASPEHDRAAGNVYASLHAQLTGKSCEPFTSDMRVHVPACNRYFYPDVSVACGSQFESLAGVRSLTNPTLVVEVLSETTERTDRGDKLICYQTLPSLTAYIIAAQDRPLVQVYERQPDGSWRYTLYQGLEAEIFLPAIGCRMPLADVYARVEFRKANEDKPEFTPEQNASESV